MRIHIRLNRGSKESIGLFEVGIYIYFFRSFFIILFTVLTNPVTCIISLGVGIILSKNFNKGSSVIPIMTTLMIESLEKLFNLKREL